MFKGNEKLRKAGEKIEMSPEQVQEYIRCKEDIIHFAEHYFYQVTLDEGLKICKLRDYQKKILKCYVDPPKGKDHVILMQPRQTGKTVITSLYIVWFILFNSDKMCYALANKQETSLEILDRIKIGYENLPLWLQQGIELDGWNKLSLSLENGSRIKASTTSSSSISGKSVSLLYIDELSKIPSHIAEEFITATYPVITSGKTSKIIISSTPLGLNHFWMFWNNAVKNLNNFYPVRVDWWEVPGKDEEWKRKIISDIGVKSFSQEFGLDFLGSSSTLIDGSYLQRIEIKEPIDLKWSGLLQIYEQPEDNSFYILGVDSAKGVGGDSSVINVLKIDSEIKSKQVALYRNDKIDTHNFAQVCISVSKFYNGAYIMIENNAEGGEVAQTIWYEYEYDKLVNLEKKGLGVRSDKQSKLSACLLLKRHIESGWLEICDQRTVFELSKFTEVTPNVFKAESNEDHDDIVASLMWALYFVNTPYFDKKDISIKKVDEVYDLGGVEDDEPVAVFDGNYEYQDREEVDYINF